jgi:hypothetical protein
MGKLYCASKEFEELVSLKESMLYKIMYEFYDVIVDIDVSDLEELLTDERIIRKLKRREYAGIETDDEVFAKLAESDYSDFLNDILILPKDIDVKKIRSEFGIMALHIEDDLFDEMNRSFSFSFNAKSKNNKFKNWSELFNKRKIPVVNSAILIDNFLWKDMGDFSNDNDSNLYPIFEAIIPSKLQVPFHIIIILQNKNAGFKRKTLHEKINKVKKRLKKSKGVEIIIGVATQTDTKLFHKRVILTNYHYIHSDKGFTTFDGERVKNITSGSRNWVFKDILDYDGDIDKHHHADELRKVYDLVYSRRGDNEVVFREGNMENPLFL